MFSTFCFEEIKIIQICNLTLVIYFLMRTELELPGLCQAVMKCNTSTVICVLSTYLWAIYIKIVTCYII